jgi:tRNA(adenine34) deaminase
LAEAHNEKEYTKDPTAHAEVLAIRRATQFLGNWRLSDCTLYVTLEPCIMCLGAIIAARFEKVVIGARDPKAGAIVSTYKFMETKHFNHYPRIELDVLADRSSEILKKFFQDLRNSKKS